MVNQAVKQAKRRGKKPEKGIEKAYRMLQLKYELPALSELDKEFMIGTLELDGFLLRSILVKMADRCDFAIKILSCMLQPENRLADMQEAGHLNEIDKQKIMVLFRKLSYYEKEFLIREFDYGEAGTAKFIVDFYKDWTIFKPDLLLIIRSMQDTWKASASKKNDYSYFG